MARTLRLAFALLVLGCLVPAPPAPAQARTVRRVLAESKILTRRSYPAGRMLVGLPAVYLRAGENRLVHGRLRAQNRTRRNIGQLVGISCGAGTVVTTRNNEGNDRRYREGPGVLAIRVRALLAADRSGWYSCSLWGAALHPGTVVALAPGGGTFVEMTRASLPGAVQRFEDRCAGSGVSPGCYLVPSTTRQEGTSFPAATAVLEGARPAAEPASTADGAVNGHGVQRALEAAAAGSHEGVLRELSRRAPPISVTYIADLEVTTCYRNTGSCLDVVDRYAQGGGSVVETQIEVLQGDLTARSAGEAAGIPAGSATGCPLRRRGPAVRTVITNDAHHQKIHRAFAVALDPASACGRDVVARLRVRAVSGNPIKIEAGPLPDGLGLARVWNAAWYSNAIVAVR